MISIGFKDVLDVVLVALLLYYIYRLMKESSSANIFGGIFVFIVVWIFVSQIFEMRLLGGILDKVVNVGSLALIILFQEEIRQFFLTIGRRQSAHLLVKFFKSPAQIRGRSSRARNKISVRIKYVILRPPFPQPAQHLQESAGPRTAPDPPELRRDVSQGGHRLCLPVLQSH